MAEGDEHYPRPPDSAYAAICGAFPAFNCLAFTDNAVREDGPIAGHFIRAVVRDGMVIAGQWQKPQLEDISMVHNPEYIHRKLDGAAVKIANAIRHFANIGNPASGSLSRDARYCNDFVSETSQAAEHLAKALLAANGIDPIRVHKLDALASQAQDAGLTDLARALRRLNGTTHEDHMQDYVDPPATPNQGKHAVKRLCLTASLLADNLPNFELWVTGDEAIDLLTNIKNDTTASAIDLENASLREPGTFGSASNEALVKAVLAGKDDLLVTLDGLAQEAISALDGLQPLVPSVPKP